MDLYILHYNENSLITLHCLSLLFGAGLYEIWQFGLISSLCSSIFKEGLMGTVTYV